MLHHISFAVFDLQRAAMFYDPVLKALGYSRVWTTENAVGYGVVEGYDLFAIKAQLAPIAVPIAGFHLAFAAPSRLAVDQFYAQAIAYGGSGNGEPGLRPHYGPHYYAAFIIDPDGYRIEAVIDTPT